MSILVHPHNEQEEKVLLAFLNSLRYDYKPAVQNDEQAEEEFINQYNKEINETDAAIEAGDYISHDEVERFFAERRKATNDN